MNTTINNQSQPKVLVFDNYDSFTYNLVQIIERILNQRVDVVRNDQITLEEIGKYDKIILSPGPGIPRSRYFTGSYQGIRFYKKYFWSMPGTTGYR